jgi:hypothetical protein
MFLVRLIWAVVGCSPTALLKPDELDPVWRSAALTEQKGETAGRRRWCGSTAFSS